MCSLGPQYLVTQDCNFIQKLRIIKGVAPGTSNNQVSSGQRFSKADQRPTQRRPLRKYVGGMRFGVPVSGAEQLNTSDAHGTLPMASARYAYSRLVRPLPSRKRSTPYTPIQSGLQRNSWACQVINHCPSHNPQSRVRFSTW
jgi:hypothetical protein